MQSVRPRPALAYLGSVAWSLVAVLAIWLALKLPWLVAPHHQSLGLRFYCVNGRCEPFPSREFCLARQDICAGWRTAVFLYALALPAISLALLTILFSWLTGSRRRAASVLHAIVLTSLVLTIAAYAAVFMLSRSEWFAASDWTWSTGAGAEYMAVVSLAGLEFIASQFRTLIKGKAGNTDYESDSDSDWEDDGTDIACLASSDEDVDEEDRDFHQFQKQARRDALRAAGEA